MHQIKQINIITQQGVKTYCTGTNEVTRIENISQEFESNIVFMYQIWSNDKLIANIVNCPVEIIYDDNFGKEHL